MYKYQSLQVGQLPNITRPPIKYLKQEVDDGLSVCVDECSPCGFSVTGGIKIYQCHMIKR